MIFFLAFLPWKWLSLFLYVVVALLVLPCFVFFFSLIWCIFVCGVVFGYLGVVVVGLSRSIF